MFENISKGKIYIKRKTFPAWLTSFLLLYPFLISTLIGMLKLPSVVKYSADIAWVLILIIMIFEKKIILKKVLVPCVLFVFGILVVWSIVYIFNYQSMFYFLWGIRNNFRFYIAFIAFCVFFSSEDVTFWLNFVDICFWINIVVTFFQFFILGFEQDYLGGIFGVSRGCNGYTLIFLALVISKSCLSCMNGEEKILVCFLKIAFSLIIAAMAELKFFFIIFIIVLAGSTIITKFSFKKFLLILVSSAIFMFGISVLMLIFGEHELLNFERIIQLTTASSYSSGEDLGRFSAIPTISNTILTDSTKKIFGLGLGNCDTSAFAACNTPFFQTYEYLHYTWFSSAFIFLETGFLGLFLNLLFYVICFVFALINIKNKKGVSIYNQIALIFSLICIMLTFYNSSLRTEAGYMAYFVLALPFIGVVNEEKQLLN